MPSDAASKFTSTSMTVVRMSHRRERGERGVLLEKELQQILATLGLDGVCFGRRTLAIATSRVLTLCGLCVLRTAESGLGGSCSKRLLLWLTVLAVVLPIGCRRHNPEPRDVRTGGHGDRGHRVGEPYTARSQVIE